VNDYKYKIEDIISMNLGLLIIIFGIISLARGIEVGIAGSV